MGGLRTGVETAGEKVYHRLRSDIIFGRLAPSQKLKLEGLKDAYGISISTLRELLNRLTSEGLIVAESARGFEVAPVSAENFKELANLRLLLECHALQRSFAVGDMDWEGRVVAAHHKLATMEKRTLAGDSPRSRNFETIQLRISSGTAVGLRFSRPAGLPCSGLRQIRPLFDDRRYFPRRCRAGASETVGLRAEARRQDSPGHPCNTHHGLRVLHARQRVNKPAVVEPARTIQPAETRKPGYSFCLRSARGEKPLRAGGRQY